MGHGVREVAEELVSRPVGLTERELLVEQPPHGIRGILGAAVQTLRDPATAA
ncbi:hypothetical protein [Streptomyces cyaneofuscatus]|uniref:hypothetical protein n=1 Tax=Streptomyces cyaneofuscatus TaxID=66883 RepID=UPI0037D6C9AF